MLAEVGRVIDRSRLSGAVTDSDVAELHAQLRRLTRAISLVGVNDAIMERAGGAMPTALGALDAIHLVTALEVQRELRLSLVMATHNIQLARAAQASGMDVVG